ncbi:MAG: hypothetical protein U0T79_03250 [Ferruginibacter sp.]
MSEEKDLEKQPPASNDSFIDESNSSGAPFPEDAKAVSEEPAVNQPESSNPKPETALMDVHHHSHEHGKRSWRSYFWEFIMLFLAVFCGFLAEYQLEHKIEGDREKQFISSILQDLKADIDSIARIKIHRKERYSQADSLRTYLLNGGYKTNGSDVYYWGRNVSRRRFFISADGTMNQLKNSGGLRLIRHSRVARKIIAYDVAYRSYLFQFELEQQLVNEYREIAARVFDAAVFQTIASNTLNFRPPGNPQLADDSRAMINELCNRLNYLMGSQFRLTQLLDELNEKATEVINLIEKEYHPE